MLRTVENIKELIEAMNHDAVVMHSKPRLPQVNHFANSLLRLLTMEAISHDFPFDITQRLPAEEEAMIADTMKKMVDRIEECFPV